MTATPYTTLKNNFEKAMLCTAFAEANTDCPCPEQKEHEDTSRKNENTETFKDTLTCIAYAEADTDCPIDTKKNSVQ
ncbi:hypothetical protein [Desulfovibrio subterraneus]|uniref:Uncharacterized protein n=1 Tax=Desulfovibrio subterraneus TaxID=2718620 RepID=A0A7J0BJR6_9BACT|nr:hypothetical protein [Desulfovibrio subterraneus]GFM33956.1 hypothetical protein DSM101010T_23210 [Desulfovibrio subterraneus]